MKDKLDTLIFILENWKRKSVFLSLLVMITIKYSHFVYSELDFSSDTIFSNLVNSTKIQFTTIIYLAICFILSIFWFFSRRIRKTKKGDTGIIFSIETYNSKTRIKVKNDFIDCINSDLEKYGKFHITDLPKYYVDKINKKNKAEAVLLKKSNSKLIIYGKVDLRRKDGKECYYLHFGAALQHKPISTGESRILGRNMRSVIPVDLFFLCDNEFNGFQFTTKLYSIVSRFILGIGAYVSNDTELALKLHWGVYSDSTVFNKSENDFLSYKIIKTQVKKMIAQESCDLAIHFLAKKELDKVSAYLKIVEIIDNGNYRYLLAKAVYLFCLSRNVDESMNIMVAASKNKKDYIWAYNLAFLHAYKGELDKAYHYYEIAFAKCSVLHIHSDVETFIYEVLEEEPDKIQLYYCLGLIYLKKMEDYVLAKDAFEKFILKARQTGTFLSHIVYSEQYLTKCVAN